MDPRESAAFIAKVAQDVTIHNEGIKRVATEIVKAIDSKEFVPSQMMLHSYPMPTKADEASIEWLFVVDTLNFSFWEPEENKHYTVELHGQKYSGYIALCAAVTKALEDGVPVTSSSYYSNITADDINKIFNISTNIPMPEDRLKNLQEAGHVLIEKFDGAFTNCVKQANHSAKELLRLIVDNFPSFQDVASIEGETVAFYKRAQILVADIWGLFKGEGLGKFHDIDCITMFADYRVPQSLVHFGALKYSEELKEKLSNNHLFKNGDREEIEIRGCSIHAVELVREQLQEHSFKFNEDPLKITSAMIDYFLWEYRRRHAADLASIPYHKVRCIYY